MGAQKQVAIITGASSGIGLASVKIFLSAGCKVFGTDVSPAPSLDAAHSSSFKFCQANITEASATTRIVSACQAAFGPKIDILLNVAGIMDGFQSVETLKDEDWEKVISVNLTAPTKLMREVVKVMKEHKGGSIVNVTSKAGISGAAAGVAYTASKHGLVGISYLS
jgi:NAD(P)-dependent dehydrogenase (short-subunit alcohol dehydrogenase family)